MSSKKAVFIDIDVHDRLKMAAAQSRVSIKTFLEALISRKCTEMKIPKKRKAKENGQG